MFETETIDVLPGAGLTETYVVTLQQGENGVVWVINEALLKEFKETNPFNITSFLERDISRRTEVLKGIAPVYEMLPLHPIIKIEEFIKIREVFINKEREENLRAYRERKAQLYQRYAGRYVVIAKGEVQGVGESFDDLKYVALDANHRFIFKVEPKEKVGVTLRWPIKTK